MNLLYTDPRPRMGYLRLLSPELPAGPGPVLDVEPGPPGGEVPQRGARPGRGRAGAAAGRGGQHGVLLPAALHPHQPQAGPHRVPRQAGAQQHEVRQKAVLS